MFRPLVLLSPSEAPSATGSSERAERIRSASASGIFAKLTRRRLKHGVFPCVADWQSAINHFIEEHNMEPRPFTWRADPDEIIAARNRGFQTLESNH